MFAALVPPGVVTSTLAVPALPAGVVHVAVDVLDPLSAERARPADEPVDLVPLVEEQLREIRAVLPGDAGDEGDVLGSRHG